MNHNKHFVFAAFILACGIFFASGKIAKAVSNFRNFEKYVEVKGLDETIVKSTQASWQISFTNTADDLVKIYQNVSDSQKTVTQFLINAGFQESEIELQPISVVDNKADAYVAQNYPNAMRYKATTTISLLTNKVDLVAQTLQKTSFLIQNGITVTSNTVRYIYTDLNLIKKDMLDKATLNARDAARSFAKVAKADLGGIRQAQQGVFSITSASGNSEYDESSVMKKVRVVTSIQFFLAKLSRNPLDLSRG